MSCKMLANPEGPGGAAGKSEEEPTSSIGRRTPAFRARAEYTKKED